MQRWIHFRFFFHQLNWAFSLKNTWIRYLYTVYLWSNLAAQEIRSCGFALGLTFIAQHTLSLLQANLIFWNIIPTSSYPRDKCISLCARKLRLKVIGSQINVEFPHFISGLSGVHSKFTGTMNELWNCRWRILDLMSSSMDVVLQFCLRGNTHYMLPIYKSTETTYLLYVWIKKSLFCRTEEKKRTKGDRKRARIDYTS